MRRELREGDRVLTVSAFLITKEVPRPRALLLKHAKLGCWLQPGGHVESDQDPIMALIEECEVEVGIDVEPYLRPLSTFGNVDVLRLPAHLTSIKIPAGKPNPGDPRALHDRHGLPDLHPGAASREGGDRGRLDR
jgi:8-oxo-dGTP diphosphatase